MEKIKKYEAILLQVLHNQVIELKGSDVKDIVIADTQKRHYQLLRLGWHTPDFFINKIVIHFHIADTGKIWLLKNLTEDLLTDELMKAGVPHTDIVLGFHPERYRTYTDFAVA